ncbi:MAG: hypothetical protein RL346_1855 [Verrucomicrobiota bacterium]|jgi:hypothetical protein
MKTKRIVTILTLTACLAWAHEGIELGPNQGRILEFSNDESMHGEVTEHDGKLLIALLDKDMKPVTITVQEIRATSGTREQPLKMEVTKKPTAFGISVPNAGDWVIIQYKENPDSKPVTARLHYDTKPCAPCGNPEWRCACESQKK